MRSLKFDWVWTSYNLDMHWNVIYAFPNYKMSQVWVSTSHKIKIVFSTEMEYWASCRDYPCTSFSLNFLQKKLIKFIVQVKDFDQKVNYIQATQRKKFFLTCICFRSSNKKEIFFLVFPNRSNTRYPSQATGLEICHISIDIGFTIMILNYDNFNKIFNSFWKKLGTRFLVENGNSCESTL